jgi:hypothetical protein
MEPPFVKGRAFGSPLARGLKPRASTAAFSTPGKPGASAAVKKAMRHLIIIIRLAQNKRSWPQIETASILFILSRGQLT